MGDNCLYFEANKSAIVLKDLSLEELANKMEFAIENKEEIAAIGREGNAVGQKHFDYRGYVDSFGDFATCCEVDP